MHKWIFKFVKQLQSNVMSQPVIYIKKINRIVLCCLLKLLCISLKVKCLVNWIFEAKTREQYIEKCLGWCEYDR